MDDREVLENHPVAHLALAIYSEMGEPIAEDGPIGEALTEVIEVVHGLFQEGHQAAKAAKAYKELADAQQKEIEAANKVIASIVAALQSPENTKNDILSIIGKIG